MNRKRFPGETAIPFNWRKPDMKPAVGLALIIALMVAGDLLFYHGRGLQALEIGVSHLMHKRLVE